MTIPRGCAAIHYMSANEKKNFQQMDSLPIDLIYLNALHLNKIEQIRVISLSLSLATSFNRHFSHSPLSMMVVAEQSINLIQFLRIIISTRLTISALFSHLSKCRSIGCRHLIFDFAMNRIAYIKMCENIEHRTSIQFNFRKFDL